MAMLNNQRVTLPVSRFFSRTCQVFTAYLAPEKPTEVSARLLPGAMGFTLGNHHPQGRLTRPTKNGSTKLGGVFLRILRFLEIWILSRIFWNHSLKTWRNVPQDVGSNEDPDSERDLGSTDGCGAKVSDVDHWNLSEHWHIWLVGGLEHVLFFHILGIMMVNAG